MKILIVGGGIAGLSLAAFLRDSEIEYDIVEKLPDSSQQGYLIGVWDSGRDILRKLQLADVFDATGAKADHVSIRNGKGDVLRDIDLSPFYSAYGLSARLLPRADIHTWLLEKADPSRMRTGISVEKIVQMDDGVRVTLTNGEEGTYDLVVGADGVHSKVRALVFGELLERYENWRIWCAWIDNAFGRKAAIVEYVEASEFACVMSTGTRTSVWLVAPADHTVWDTEAHRIARLREIFKPEPALLPALDALRDSDVQPSDLAQVQLRSWSKERVVLAGEAAHCTGPYGGMGTTMALEDGYVLAGELLQVSKTYPLSIALKEYEKKRKPRVVLADRMNMFIRSATLIRSPLIRRAMTIVVRYVPFHWLFWNVERLMKKEI